MLYHKLFTNDAAIYHYGGFHNQGPVVQSVVSVTSSLRVISLTVLADSIYNILIFFAEKKLLTFFQQKISVYWLSLDVNFNESLTNDIISFEQLDPERLPLETNNTQQSENWQLRFIKSLHMQQCNRKSLVNYLIS